jgi:hypothetical protein
MLPPDLNGAKTWHSPRRWHKTRFGSFIQLKCAGFVQIADKPHADSDATYSSAAYKWDETASRHAHAQPHVDRAEFGVGVICSAPRPRLRRALGMALAGHGLLRRHARPRRHLGHLARVGRRPHVRLAPPQGGH